MNTLRALVLAGLVAAAAGCGVELLTTTAIQGELQAKQAKSALGHLRYAENTASRISIQQAVDVYRAEKGVNPATLDALVPEYLPSIPEKADGGAFGYDPATGTVTDRPVPQPVVQGPTEADIQKMNQLAVAIDTYGRNTGYYPGSLAALVPDYLVHVPVTDGGQAFLYDPQTGAVYHPAQERSQGAAVGPRQQVQQPMGMGAGAGPMGEMMTGIAIQNQLNSMSNAGAASARTRARQNIDQSFQGHDQRQQRIMDDLGL